MFRHNRAFLALTLAMVLFAGVSAALAQEPAAQSAPSKPVWVNPIRGTAEIQYTKPVIKVEKDGTIVTTFQVKNVSTGPIARLTIEEFWWDKNNNPVSGDKQFLRKPLMQGETGTIVLRTPKNPNMSRNSYKFSHQNGDIKPKQVPKL
ncbi:MAG TPA: hypothetical protein VF332_08575 [Vicinamibacterales bacterium]|jgi:hypothetical protein